MSLHSPSDFGSWWALPTDWSSGRGQRVVRPFSSSDCCPSQSWGTFNRQFLLANLEGVWSQLAKLSQNWDFS